MYLFSSSCYTVHCNRFLVCKLWWIEHCWCLHKLWVLREDLWSLWNIWWRQEQWLLTAQWRTCEWILSLLSYTNKLHVELIVKSKKANDATQNRWWLCGLSNLKHKDSFGKSENLSKIFFAEILVFDHDYEGKSSSSNGLLWISFIFKK